MEMRWPQSTTVSNLHRLAHRNHKARSSAYHWSPRFVLLSGSPKWYCWFHRSICRQLFCLVFAPSRTSDFGLSICHRACRCSLWLILRWLRWSSEWTYFRAHSYHSSTFQRKNVRNPNRKGKLSKGESSWLEHRFSNRIFCHRLGGDPPGTWRWRRIPCSLGCWWRVLSSHFAIFWVVKVWWLGRCLGLRLCDLVSWSRWR